MKGSEKVSVLRRSVAIFLALSLLVLLTGCAGESREADRDVLTIMLPRLNLAELDMMIRNIEGIQFEVEYYSGQNTSEYLVQKLSHGDASDIIISTVKFSDELQEGFMLDLSGYDFTGNYDINMLGMFTVGDSLYMLPGPIQLRSMAYNRTLFEEYGWEVPRNHQEMVDLVKQIRAESDLTPITFSAAGAGFYFTTMTTYAQAGFLSTPDGYNWERQYLAGEVSCEKGFRDGIDLLQELIDADAYDIIEDEDHWDGETVEKFVTNRGAAMMAVWSGQSYLAEGTYNSTDEFGLFPFYGPEDGDSFLGAGCSVYFGLSKRLGEPGNEKKLEQALQVLEFFSTPEGMQYLKTGIADIMPLNDYEGDLCHLYKEIWQLNLTGHKAFMLYTGYEDVMLQAAYFIKDAMISGGSLDGLVELIDETHAAALASDSNAAYGTVAERFTREETAQLNVNVLDSAGVADFALMTMGGAHNGVYNYEGAWGLLYEGDIDLVNVNVTIPNKTRIMTLTLTGTDIMRLIGEGKPLTNDDGTVTEYFRYYWSGLDVETKNGEIISIKIDGEELDAEKTYTVAFIDGDYTAEIAERGVPTDTGLIFRDVFVEYVCANDPLTPPEVY